MTAAPQLPPDGPADRRRRAKRTILFGVVVFLLAAPMVLSPAWLGRGKLTACVAGFGFVAACLGLNCVLQGGWDLLREK